MTTLVGLLTAAATAIVLAALGHILAGIAAAVLCAIAITLLLFARQAIRRIARGIRRY